MAKKPHVYRKFNIRFKTGATVAFEGDWVTVNNDGTLLVCIEVPNGYYPTRALAAFSPGTWDAVVEDSLIPPPGTLPTPAQVLGEEEEDDD